MKNLLKLLLILSAGLFRPAQSLASETRLEIGPTVGVNTPYGMVGSEMSVDYGAFDFNLGAGIGTGFTYGVGSRYHFFKDECFFLKNCRDSLFIGLNLSHSDSSTLTKVDDYDTEYKIPSMEYINTNIGDKTVLYDRVALYISLGYKQPLSTKKARYISGVENEKTKEAANISLKAGTEVSVALLYRI